MNYVLLLNDMRRAHIEDVEPVAYAMTAEALQQYLQREKVECYSDPTGLPEYDPSYIPDNPYARQGRNNPKSWQKVFRKDGPLEWFNAPFNMQDAIRPCHSRDEAMMAAGRHWDHEIGSLPFIS